MPPSLPPRPPPRDLPAVIDLLKKLWAAKYREPLPRVSFHRGSLFNAAEVPPSDGAGRHCYASKVGKSSESQGIPIRMPGILEFLGPGIRGPANGTEPEPFNL